MLLNQLNGADGQNTGSDPALRNLALAAMVNEAPLLNYAQFYSMTGNADSLTKNADAVGGGVRTLDADYTPVTTDLDEATVTLRILGGVVNTDQARERRGYTPGSERSRQLESFSAGIGRLFTDQFVNGSNSSGQMNGIKTQIASGQVLSLAGEANGYQVLLGSDNDAVTSQETFKEYIEEMISKVKGTPTVLLMNAATKRRLGTIWDKKVTTTSVADVMGAQYRVTTWDGIPIVDTGYNIDESGLVIPSTETLGTSSDCTSIYAVRFGEAKDCSIATNIGVVVKDQGKVGVYYSTMVEFDANVVLQNVKSIARLKGIRFA